MAGNPNWGELVTATLALRRKQISDAVSKSNIFTYEIKRRGRVKTADGGRTITQPVMLADENVNFMWYLGRDALNIAGQEVLTSAEFPWKQYACGVSISGLEMLQNSGTNQVIDMLAARVQHARKTIENQMAKSAHGDGTSFSGKEFGGMALLIAAAAGATVGGINSTTYTWWDNQRVITGAAPGTSTIFGNMLSLFLKTKRGAADKVNMISADDTWFSVFVQSLQAQQRFSNGKLAEAGFSNILFMGDVPVVSDGGIGGYAPAGMKFVNLDTIELTMHKQRNNVVLNGPRRPLTEDSDTAIIAGMGNYTVSNRMLNGVLQT